MKQDKIWIGLNIILIFVYAVVTVIGIILNSWMYMLMGFAGYSVFIMCLIKDVEANTI